MLIASLIFLQVVIFAALIFILRRIMTQNVALATRHLDELNQEYTEKERHASQEMEEARTKSKEMVLKAQDEAQVQKTQIIKEASEERDRMLSVARTQCDEMIQQAERSRHALISEMEERVAHEAIGKACELIQHTLPDLLREEVHAHWVKELIQTGFKELERLRIPADVHEVKVTAAFALSDGERNALSRRLKETLGREVKLVEEVDERVVAGLIISIGSLVLDGSLKNKIQERAKGAPS